MIREFLAAYLMVINIIAFSAFGIDKLKAKTDSWRISEKTLLILAFIGGAAGALAGMTLFHHKVNASRKPAFVYGIPAMLLLQIAGIVLVFIKTSQI